MVELLISVVEAPHTPLYTDALMAARGTTLSIPQSAKSPGPGFCVLGFQFWNST